MPRKRKGGRPRSREPEVHLGIRLPAALRERLREAAKAEGTDSTKLIRRAILRELELHDEIYR